MRIYYLWLGVIVIIERLAFRIHSQTLRLPSFANPEGETFIFGPDQKTTDRKAMRASVVYRNDLEEFDPVKAPRFNAGLKY